ncbi:MAG TPA: hypothetical protein VH092_26590, partial [Urbifossiella sp.]|nr:hypothetical protein [Urbifossiella sp.]
MPNPFRRPRLEFGFLRQVRTVSGQTWVTTWSRASSSPRRSRAQVVPAGRRGGAATYESRAGIRLVVAIGCSNDSWCFSERVGKRGDLVPEPGMESPMATTFTAENATEALILEQA